MTTFLPLLLLQSTHHPNPSSPPLRILTLLFLVLTLQIRSVLSVEWHFVAFYTDSSSGQAYIGQSGNMQVPPLPEAETDYLWPGLQPTDDSGVYQNVLDGRSGTWWIGSGWCCSNPSLAWGSGFNVYEGDVVAFNNSLGSDAWTSTLSSGSNSVNNSFALTSKSFNEAVFAIELYDSWDFGPLTFTDIVLTANGSSTSFCTSSPTNYNDATAVSITGVTATVGDGYVTCTIESLVLESAT